MTGGNRFSIHFEDRELKNQLVKTHTFFKKAAPIPQTSQRRNTSDSNELNQASEEDVLEEVMG